MDRLTRFYCTHTEAKTFDFICLLSHLRGCSWLSVLFVGSDPLHSV